MINHYQYSNVYQILVNMLNQLVQQRRIHPAVAEKIKQDMAPDPYSGQYGHTALYQLIDRAFGQAWASGRAPHAQEISECINRHLESWINYATMQLTQGQTPYAPQQQQPMYMHPPYGANSSGTVSGTGYDNSLLGPADPRPTPAAPAPMPSDTFDTSMFHTTQPLTPAEEPMRQPLSGDIDISAIDEADILVFNGNGFKRDMYLTGVSESDTKVTYMSYTALRPATSVGDIMRRFWPRFRSAPMTGEWSVRVNFMKLVTLPISTTRFSDFIAETLWILDGSTKLPDVVAAIGESTKNNWSVMEKLLCKEMTRRMIKYARRPDDPSRYLSIESLDDAVEVIMFPNKCPAAYANHAHFMDIVLDSVVHPTVKTFFSGGNPTYIIQPEAGRLSDFLLPDEIELDHTHAEVISKYDVLALDPESRKSIVADMASKHTVMRFPSSIVIQNIVPGDRAMGPERVDQRMFGKDSSGKTLPAKALHESECVFGVRGMGGSEVITAQTAAYTLDNDLVLDPKHTFSVAFD